MLCALARSRRCEGECHPYGRCIPSVKCTIDILHTHVHIGRPSKIRNCCYSADSRVFVLRNFVIVFIFRFLFCFVCLVLCQDVGMRQVEGYLDANFAK